MEKRVRARDRWIEWPRAQREITWFYLLGECVNIIYIGMEIFFGYTSVIRH